LSAKVQEEATKLLLPLKQTTLAPLTFGSLDRERRRIQRHESVFYADVKLYGWCGGVAVVVMW